MERWKPMMSELPDDFLQFSHFERVVRELEWTSSPGYPYMHQFASNGAMFAVQEGVPSRDRIQMVWEIVQRRLVERTSDPIRLFVKQEPHKLKKINNKAYRLISSVSVVDQLIDAMLFDTMNQSMVDNLCRIPSKVGWGPHVGGWKMVPACGFVSLDKSSWDWTVQGWIITLLVRFRIMLCKNPTLKWMELVQWRYRELYGNPVFVTSGGVLLKQRSPGVMKSGCYNTITDNTIMQDILHLRASLEADVPVTSLWAMGDDTLQRSLPPEMMAKYLAVLSKYCVIKEVIQGVEFAGHRFEGGYVEPLYTGKHAFNLLHVKEEVFQETAVSYALLYHRSRLQARIKVMLRAMGAELPSDLVLDMIYDGDE